LYRFDTAERRRSYLGRRGSNGRGPWPSASASWRVSASVGCADTVSGVEPRSQFMNCLRCHGLMVTIRLEDAGSSSLCFSGWQCLQCGEVIDSVINVNRKELHGPMSSRSRVRYGVSLVQ
jgi:hypothetical protein